MELSGKMDLPLWFPPADNFTDTSVQKCDDYLPCKPTRRKSWSSSRHGRRFAVPRRFVPAPFSSFFSLSTVRLSVFSHSAFILAQTLVLVSYVVVLLQMPVVHSFNLEPRLPVIKRGNRDTFFGYSVAQHAIRASGSDSSRVMLLVGAPQGDSNIPGVRQSGAVFACPFSADENDCRLLPTPSSNTAVLNDGFVPDASRAWLGISVSSQGAGKSVLACAHLYRKSKQLRDNSTVILIPGICYSYNNKLNFQKYWDGCQGMQWEDIEKSPHELYGQCLQGVGSYIDAQSNEMLIGAPAALNYKGVVVQNWIERIFGQLTKWHLSSASTVSTSLSANTPRKSNVLTLSDVTSPSPIAHTSQSAGPVVAFDSYLGMAVVIGRFLANPDEILYVAGAPRSRLTGEVIAFTNSSGDLIYYGRLQQGGVGSQFGYALAKADVNGDGLDDLFVGAPNYFTGRRTGSGLVPGQHEQQEIRHGAVYAYYSVIGQSLPFTTVESPSASTGGGYTAVMYGKYHDGRFGASLASVGDLNNDGYGDLAIGAPYEDDGRGAVYIFQGSERGLNREPSQIITANSLPVRGSGLVSFGASLSGGMDADNNGYPDLLIGAYESDAAVLLLSRPVVKIFTEIRGLPQRGINASGEPCRGVNRVCFGFQVCLDLQAVKNLSAVAGNSRTQQVHARYRIEGDVMKTLPAMKRISFANPPTEPRTDQQEPLPRYVIERQLLLNTADAFTCVEEVVFLDSAAEDTLNPLLFRLSSELVEKIKPEYPLRQLPNMDQFPIFDRLSATKSFQVNFTNDCGEDSVCESDLRLENVQLDLPLDDEQSTTPKNDDDAAPPRYLLVGGGSDKINLTLRAVNHGELAYQAKLYVDHPSVLPLVRFYAPAGITCAVIDRRQSAATSDDNQLVSTARNSNAVLPDQNDFDAATRTVACDLGNPFSTEKPIEITIEFETRNVQPLDNEIAVVLRTDTISQKREPAQPPVRVVARVVVRADAILLGTDPQGQVIYDGVARGASALVMLSDVGSPVVHEYELYNDGPGALPTSSLTILWPAEIAPNKRPGLDDNSAVADGELGTHYKHNKWLLYLSARPEFDHELGVSCEYDEREINPLGFAGVEKSKQSLGGGTVSRRMNLASSAENANNAPRSGRTKRNAAVESISTDKQPADTAELRNTKISPDYENVANNKKVVTFDCDRERNARCIEIQCKMPVMERGATTVIRIYSRLWKHTFLQDYRRVDYVRISSFGRLTIDPVYRIQQGNVDNDVARAITRAYPSASITADEVQRLAPWVIPLAVALGLLLLICIILALWKCGFFSRQRYMLNNSNANGQQYAGNTSSDSGADDFALAPYVAAAGISGSEGRSDDLNETFVTTPHHTTGMMLPVRMKTRDLGENYTDNDAEIIEEYNAKKFVDSKQPIFGAAPSLRHRPNADAEIDADLNEKLLGGGYPPYQQQPPVPPPKPSGIVRTIPSATSATPDVVRFTKNNGSNGNHQQPETVVIDPSRRRLAGGAAGVYNSSRRARGPVG